MAMGKLGFGLMRLPLRSADPADIDLEQLKEMVDLFLEKGFTYFDTSFVYHNGASEQAIRQALTERHDRSSFTLASKFPTFNMPKEEEVEGIFAQQLANCGVDYLDYYLLHNLNRIIYEMEVKPAHLFEHMKAWKQQGKIRRIGFSWHDDAESLDRVLSEHPEVEFVQIVVNYYDWEEPFIQAKACYEVIRKHGLEVVIMEPVKGGMLANVPEAAADAMKKHSEALSPASYALRFAASLDGVRAVLSGMSDLAQLKDNIANMEELQPLTKEEEDLLELTVAEYQKRWKFACTDWAALDDNAYHVPVSGILRAYNSLQLQPNPYFGAELNYYKSFRSGYDRAYETGDYTAQTEKIGKTFDVNAALKEAIEFETKNSFQGYVAD